MLLATPTGARRLTAGSTSLLALLRATGQLGARGAGPL